MKRYVKRVIYITIVVLIVIITYPPLGYKRLPNDNPVSENIVKGVFHIHSDFSDGKGDIKEITDAAAFHGLDFIILTDHGRPNIKCATATSYFEDVLLIGGSEFSTDCGHLAAAGFPVKKYQVPSEPQEAINYVNKFNGFSFISHPFDKKIPWQNWDIDGFTGIEILSSYSSARRISIFRLMAFPIRYLLNREYSLLGSIDYPVQNISVWDSLNTKGKYMGIYALDAHAKIPLTKKISLNLPSYKAIFSTLNVYVILDSPLASDPAAASAMIVKSIKKGKFYNVIEAVAPANGFSSTFASADGKTYTTGETIPENKGTIIMDLPFKFPVRARIIKDGDEFLTKRYSPGSKAFISVDTPGVYRCELYADEGKFKKLPWIMTNPFFVGIGQKEQTEERTIAGKKKIFNNRMPFKIEKNDFSSGEVSYSISEEGEQRTSMKFTLKGKPEERDHWVSLAARGKLDISGFGAVTFKVRSSEEMVYWIELRTGVGGNEYWYRHSFTAGTEWENISIPFKRFYLISKKRDRKDIDMSSINSLFFSINNGMMNIPEITGMLEIQDLSVIK